MKKMIIFEPPMCCSTGVCGPSVDSELLRVSTVIYNLKSNGIEVERHNLSSNPQIFIDNKVINEILDKEGIEAFPVTIVDGEVAKTKEYPTELEFIEFLQIMETDIRFNRKSCEGCSLKDACTTKSCN